MVPTYGQTLIELIKHRILKVFLKFEIWVKDFKVFDLRLRFMVNNCIYFTPCVQENRRINTKVLEKKTRTYRF